ncbi:hypothetical protein [Streptomyces sp. NPDC001601]|uniref:hypothetical protein n=1 Tax=unclassified Streptomyces TaxID=2593676 RepID=UPI0036A3EA01
MAHRITRFLRSLCRRPRVHGPTVHHTWYQPPVDPVAVYGIGMGSCGMLTKDARVTR